MHRFRTCASPIKGLTADILVRPSVFLSLLHLPLSQPVTSSANPTHRSPWLNSHTGANPSTDDTHPIRVLGHHLKMRTWREDIGRW
jgi:hypothetical protein